MVLDESRMDESVKSRHPDIYRDAFASTRLATIAGASIIAFPLCGVATVGTVSERLGLAFESTVWWGVGAGLAVSLVLNLIYFARLRHETARRAALLEVARGMYPDAVPYINGEKLGFNLRT